MPNIEQTIAEVLRLDAEATQGPWDYWFEVGTRLGPSREHPVALVKQLHHARCPGGVRGAGVDADAALIAHYRTAAPALARELQRLRAEIQPRIERSIAFQDAMEEAEAERDEARAEVERLKAELKRCRPSCVVCGSSVHSDRFCGDACYHKHYVRLEEDDDDE